MKNCFIFFILQNFNLRKFGENIYDIYKYSTPQFLEENDPILTKSAAQILSLNLA